MSYQVTDQDLTATGAKTRTRLNLAAIRLLKQLDTEARTATPDEQQVLAQYQGWGIAPQLFAEPPDPSWQALNEELRQLLTDAEYDSARRSILDAYYTPPELVRTIHAGLAHLGFTGGQILEPAIGTGIWFGTQDQAIIDRSTRIGIELDPISGRIAQHLYPDATIYIQGYETVAFPNDTFDAIIGNFPYGSHTPNDFAYNEIAIDGIHNYFAIKSIDKVRPGGLVAFLTSVGTMQSSKADEVRAVLAEKANLVAAFRLPGNTFKHFANTEVTADLLILQKLGNGIEPNGMNWQSMGETEILNDEGNKLVTNQYFLDHPNHVLGSWSRDKLYPNERLAVVSDGRDVISALEQAFTQLPANLYRNLENSSQTEQAKTLIPPELQGKAPSGSFIYHNERLWQSTGYVLVESAVSGRPRDRILGLIEVRNALQEVYAVQLAGVNDAGLKIVQDRLNTVYDAFVAQQDWIHSRGNKLAFKDDESFPLLLALENYDPDHPDRTTKTDIFRTRTIVPRQEPESAESAKEGLLYSLDQYQSVDIAYIGQLTGTAADSVIADLTAEDLIYWNPESETWETAEAYLSGNVVEKLELARHATETDVDLERNIAALKAIQPTPIPPGNIDVTLGSGWISVEDYEQFISELYEVPNGAKVIYSPLSAEYSVTATDAVLNHAANYAQWGTSRVSGVRLITLALNGRDPLVLDYDPINERQVTNQSETQAARLKKEQIQQQFTDWVWRDPQRTDRLADRYNELFNSHRDRRYDGSHLSFPDMNPIWRERIKGRPHQENAIWRGLCDRRMIAAHEVGAGKTAVLIALAYEAQRRGLCQKPIIVVKNHMLEQFSRDYQEIYPNARILCISGQGFNEQKRQEVIARAATGQWDTIIITQSAFDRIPVGDRILRELTQEREREVEAEQRRLGASTKNLERAREKAGETLFTIANRERKDKGVTFDMIGSSAILIDEVHDYKGQTLDTKFNRVLGIPSGTSDRADDMKLKCWWTQDQGGMIISASGTILANAIIAEAWIQLNLVDRHRLKAAGIGHFDAFVQTFGKVRTKAEVTAQTTLEVKSRLCQFQNAPEFRQLFGQAADVVLGEELGIPKPEVEYLLIEYPASAAQLKFFAWVADRATQIKNKEVDRHDDNLPAITNDIRLGVVDLRLLPMFKLTEFLDETEIQSLSIHDGKLGRVAEQAYQNWLEGQANRSTQLLFCDVGTPKPGFNAYDALRGELIAKGVPASDIAFAHDANTDSQKYTLQRQIREGQIRIAIASTEKMGVGANIQDRLHDLINVDCPWNPKALEQRIGRMERQGNLHEQVRCFNTITVGEPRQNSESKQVHGLSPDAYLWNVVQTKMDAAHTFLKGKNLDRQLEDSSGDITLNPGEIVASASGDERLMDRERIIARITQLELAQSQHINEQHRLRRDVEFWIPERINSLESEIKVWNADRSLTTDTSGERFAITILGQHYTERTLAGEALFQAAQNRPEGKYEIGQIGGFKLSIEIAKESVNTFRDLRKTTNRNLFYFFALTGQGKYEQPFTDTPLGTIRRIENVLQEQSEPPNVQIARLKQVREELESARRLVGQPFAFADELTNLRQQRNDLERELGLLETVEETIPQEVIDVPEGSNGLWERSDQKSEGVALTRFNRAIRQAVNQEQVAIPSLEPEIAASVDLLHDRLINDPRVLQLVATIHQGINSEENAKLAFQPEIDSTLVNLVTEDEQHITLSNRYFNELAFGKQLSDEIFSAIVDQTSPLQVPAPNMQTGRAEQQIAKLLTESGIAEALFKDKEFYLNVENEPYQRLSIERHDEYLYFTRWRYDDELILDSEAVFEIKPTGHLDLIETASLNPFTGGESRFKDRAFADGTFVKALHDQGFVEAIQTVYQAQSSPEVIAQRLATIVRSMLAQSDNAVLSQPIEIETGQYVFESGRLLVPNTNQPYAFVAVIDTSTEVARPVFSVEDMEYKSRVRVFEPEIVKGLSNEIEDENFALFLSEGPDARSMTMDSLTDDTAVLGAKRINDKAAATLNQQVLVQVETAIEKAIELDSGSLDADYATKATGVYEQAIVSIAAAWQDRFTPAFDTYIRRDPATSTVVSPLAAITEQVQTAMIDLYNPSLSSHHAECDAISGIAEQVTLQLFANHRSKTLQTSNQPELSSEVAVQQEVLTQLNRAVAECKPNLKPDSQAYLSAVEAISQRWQEQFTAPIRAQVEQYPELDLINNPGDQLLSPLSEEIRTEIRAIYGNYLPQSPQADAIDDIAVTIAQHFVQHDREQVFERSLADFLNRLWNDPTLQLQVEASPYNDEQNSRITFEKRFVDAFADWYSTDEEQNLRYYRFIVNDGNRFEQLSAQLFEEWKEQKINPEMNSEIAAHIETILTYKATIDSDTIVGAEREQLIEQERIATTAVVEAWYDRFAPGIQVVVERYPQIDLNPRFDDRTAFLDVTREIRAAIIQAVPTATATYDTVRLAEGTDSIRDALYFLDRNRVFANSISVLAQQLQADLANRTSADVQNRRIAFNDQFERSLLQIRSDHLRLYRVLSTDSTYKQQVSEQLYQQWNERVANHLAPPETLEELKSRHPSYTFDQSAVGTGRYSDSILFVHDSDGSIAAHVNVSQLGQTAYRDAQQQIERHETDRATEPLPSLRTEFPGLRFERRIGDVGWVVDAFDKTSRERISIGRLTDRQNNPTPDQLAKFKATLRQKGYSTETAETTVNPILESNEASVEDFQELGDRIRARAGAMRIFQIADRAFDSLVESKSLRIGSTWYEGTYEGYTIRLESGQPFTVQISSASGSLQLTGNAETGEINADAVYKVSTTDLDRWKQFDQQLTEAGFGAEYQRQLTFVASAVKALRLNGEAIMNNQPLPFAVERDSIVRGNGVTSLLQLSETNLPLVYTELQEELIDHDKQLSPNRAGELAAARLWNGLQTLSNQLEEKANQSPLDPIEKEFYDRVFVEEWDWKNQIIDWSKTRTILQDLNNPYAQVSVFDAIETQLGTLSQYTARQRESSEIVQDETLEALRQINSRSASIDRYLTQKLEFPSEIVLIHSPVNHVYECFGEDAKVVSRAMSASNRILDVEGIELAQQYVPHAQLEAVLHQLRQENTVVVCHSASEREVLKPFAQEQLSDSVLSVKSPVLIFEGGSVFLSAEEITAISNIFARKDELTQPDLRHDLGQVLRPTVPPSLIEGAITALIEDEARLDQTLRSPSVALEIEREIEGDRSEDLPSFRDRFASLNNYADVKEQCRATDRLIVEVVEAVQNALSSGISFQAGTKGDLATGYFEFTHPDQLRLDYRDSGVWLQVHKAAGQHPFIAVEDGDWVTIDQLETVGSWARQLDQLPTQSSESVSSQAQKVEPFLATTNNSQEEWDALVKAHTKTYVPGEKQALKALDKIDDRIKKSPTIPHTVDRRTIKLTIEALREAATTKPGQKAIRDLFANGNKQLGGHALASILVQQAAEIRRSFIESKLAVVEPLLQDLQQRYPQYQFQRSNFSRVAGEDHPHITIGDAETPRITSLYLIEATPNSFKKAEATLQKYQPVTAQSLPESTQESEKVPSQVLTRLRINLNDLRSIVQRIESARQTDQMMNGDGRYEFEATGGEHRIGIDRTISFAQSIFDQFREFAPKNGVDADRVFAELGGIPTVPDLSPEAKAWEPLREKIEAQSSAPLETVSAQSTVAELEPHDTTPIDSLLVEEKGQAASLSNECNKVPAAAISNLRNHLARLQDIVDRIAQAQSKDQQFDGNGRYEFEVAGGSHREEIERTIRVTNAAFKTFRDLAPTKDINADLVFAELGGIPTIPDLSEAAQSWEQRSSSSKNSVDATGLSPAQATLETDWGTLTAIVTPLAESLQIAVTGITANWHQYPSDQYVGYVTFDDWQEMLPELQDLNAYAQFAAKDRHLQFLKVLDEERERIAPALDRWLSGKSDLENQFILSNSKERETAIDAFQLVYPERDRIDLTPEFRRLAILAEMVPEQLLSHLSVHVPIAVNEDKRIIQTEPITLESVDSSLNDPNISSSEPLFVGERSIEDSYNLLNNLYLEQKECAPLDLVGEAIDLLERLENAGSSLSGRQNGVPVETQLQWQAQAEETIVQLQVVEQAQEILETAQSVFAFYAAKGRLVFDDQQWSYPGSFYDITFVPENENFFVAGKNGNSMTVQRVGQRIDLAATGDIQPGDLERLRKTAEMLKSAEFQSVCSPIEIIENCRHYIHRPAEQASLSEPPKQLELINLDRYDSQPIPPTLIASDPTWRMSESVTSADRLDGEETVDVQRIREWYKDARDIGRSQKHLSKIQGIGEAMRIELTPLDAKQLKVMNDDRTRWNEQATEIANQCRMTLSDIGEFYAEGTIYIDDRYALFEHEQTEALYVTAIGRGKEPTEADFAVLPEELVAENRGIILKQVDGVIDRAFTTVTNKDTKADFFLENTQATVSNQAIALAGERDR